VKLGWTGGDFIGYRAGDGYLIIGPHDKVHGKNKNPERMMLNFETADVKKEFARIKKLGVKVIQPPYHPDEDSDSESLVATFADPDNNFFQLVSPMM
jgi:predicted enzyme related to lactoylglutathione lyase